MAMTINSSPILVGESARAFIEAAERNGFKTLYKTEQEERDFLHLNDDEPLETRFMFFDLKLR
ncbi:MAG: hypothetical protein NC204_07675 [Candidatus Amulumruptor caecigallinarius]|nr:hypothetical protein [Candidatus Amulumruptor caecigallinarius]